MPSFNKVLLMGNLTRDPELRFTANNTPVCQIGVAANRKWRDQNGEMQEEVTFVDCDAWGRTAEVINQYLRKGKPIFIEGRLRLDQWQDKDGNPRSRLKVVVENFQFIDSKGGDGGQGGPPGGGGDYEAGGPPSAPPGAAPQRAPYQPRGQAPRQYNNPPQGQPPQGSPPPQAPPPQSYQQPPMEPHQPVDDADIPF